MNLTTFIQSETERMLSFEHYWLSKVAPKLTEEEQQFWESEATVWDWIEQLEDSGI